MARLALAQFLVALAMGAAALSFFLWASFSGLWREVEDVKHEVLWREIGDARGEAAARDVKEAPRPRRRREAAAKAAATREQDHGGS